MTCVIEIVAMSKPNIWYKGKIGNIYHVELTSHPTSKQPVFLYGDMNIIYIQDALILKIIYQSTHVKNGKYKKFITKLKRLNCQFYEKAL